MRPAMSSTAQPETSQSVYGDFLKKTLSPALVCGLTEILECRPKDPIEYLAKYLLRHRTKNSSAQDVGTGSTGRILDSQVQEGESVQLSQFHVHMSCGRIFGHIGDIFDDNDLF